VRSRKDLGICITRDAQMAEALFEKQIRARDHSLIMDAFDDKRARNTCNKP